jgi:hypothetical protein
VRLSYSVAMRWTNPSTLGSLLLALAACPGDKADTGISDPGTTSTSSSSGTTSATPTTTVADPTTTTGGSETGTSTTTATTTTGESSTTGAPATNCVEYTDENSCEQDDACNWASVFQFTHGAQGCQGDVVDFCVSAAVDTPSTWYRGEDGDYQVVQFEYTPDDLPPEWKLCDCDGPLACFCSGNAPECPERYQEFCGATTTELSCTGSAINGEFRCAWFRIDPQGPKDDKCSPQPFKDVCLAADTPAATMCEDEKVNFVDTYPGFCSDQEMDPVYWREVDGDIEVTTHCGPVPPAPEWTACSETDTPDQPDECKCLCL